jgi:hypothetical protein
MSIRRYVCTSFSSFTLTNNPRVDMVVLHSVTSASSQTNELEVLLSTNLARTSRCWIAWRECLGRSA